MGQLEWQKPSPEDVVEVSRDRGTGATMLSWFCPGCKRHSLHMIPVHIKGQDKMMAISWEWNGSRVQPSLSPSIRHIGVDGKSGDCHYFMKDGKFVFCSDSFHDLKGQTVKMRTVAEAEEEEFGSDDQTSR